MALSQQNIGYVAVVPKGDFVQGTTYQPLNVVRYQNYSYMAKRTTSAVPTTGASDDNWMMLNEDTSMLGATTAPPSIAQNGAVGSSANFAREDHTHAGVVATGTYPQMSVGNATNATNATNAENAANSNTVGGYAVEVVADLPDAIAENTIYLIY